MTYPTLKYSRSKVNKAGEILVKYFYDKDPNIKERDAVMSYSILSNWRAIHTYPINTFQSTLRNKLKTIDPTALVAQRLKRIPSIIQKLKRFENMHLSRMQDIGGLRAVVSSLPKVEQLKENYHNSRFKHGLHSFRDYIQNPKQSGYRSIHLVYKYKNPICPNYDGLFVELQIRSRLQHAWATAVETMGTYLEYSLKSSEGPDEWLNFFSLVGSAFAHMENTPPVPGYDDLTKEQTYDEVIGKSISLDVKNKLLAFSVATRHVVTDKKKGSYYLIKLDLKEKTVSIATFSKDQLDEANRKYIEIEKKISDGAQLQTVLVSTGSIKNLRQAYPNYFLDTRKFVKQLERIEKIAEPE